MTSNRIGDIRDRVTDALGIGFSRVEQLGRLLEIFFRGKDQNIKFLLPQRRCQAHNAFQPICTHHAWFLVGEITAGEEG